ncbi:MAG: OFA family MFS transporter [Bacteroidetes bacterium]|nr:OFA family MFS transporter [Bacteroidota bacterium]
MHKKDQFTDLPIKEKTYTVTRWGILFAGFMLTLMGGIAYAWGVFVTPMMEDFGWTKAEAILPFTVYLLVFALLMAPAGKIQDRIGPRKVACTGAILFFIAYGLASLVDRFPYSWWLILTYGIIGGTACGLTYACVAPPARKWFPDKPGFAISLSVMGFGLAALVAAPLKADYLIPVHGICRTFLIIAIITSVVCLFSALLLRNPPKGWSPPGWNDKKAKMTTTIRQESTPSEVLRSPVFWLIWLTFALVIAGGFVSLALIPSYGEHIVGLTPVEAALAISFYAAVNGFGRPIAGFLGDRFGYLWVMIGTYIMHTATLLSFHIFAVTMPSLYIAAVFLGWAFAVTLALFPALTSLCFGSKHMGANYGLVFTAFGVGSLAPTVSSWIVSATESFTPAFVFGGILAGIGLFICVVLKKKHMIP